MSFAAIPAAFRRKMAVSSHVLSLGWRDRELQVATGFWILFTRQSGRGHQLCLLAVLLGVELRAERSRAP